MTDIQGAPKILIVDDKPENLYALEKLLEKLDVSILKATSGNEALGLLLRNEFCLALVDVQMPEMDGYELVELLRGNPDTASLPVIFISAIYSDEYHHRKGYDAGAVDFLSKPFIPEILLSKIQVFLDLYDQRMQLAEMAKQNADFYALEKERSQELAALNASKDKFFSIVSHDLRTPFTGLIGSIELLLMEMKEVGETNLQELAEWVLYSAKNAHRLLENLLTWSLMQRGAMEYQPELLALDTVVKSVADLLGQTAVQKNIDFVLSIPPETAVFADEQMLRTVLRNLISNALKFTPKGGTIRIFTLPHLSSNSFSNTVEWIELAVADTGVGIREADLQYLFQIDVHYTTEGTAQEEGSGLGLILCKEMVEKNRGKIWVESQTGKGTTVTFTLPLQVSASLPMEEAFTTI